MISLPLDDLDILRRAVSARADAPSALPTRGSAAVARLRRVLADDTAATATVADLARAVGMTPRGLQDACRRAGAPTPMHVLREVRLGRARDDLRAANADATTVREVAASHGFAHPGRFAIAYRQAFGTSPSHDLGR
ncbi:MAG: helix-turn-helix transcriptional regulator [Microbacterium sp.]